MTAVIPNSPRLRLADQAASAWSRGVRALTAVVTSVRRSRTSIANSVLQIGGLGCFDVAAFEVASPLGWAVTGASAFVLAWLLQPAGEP